MYLSLSLRILYVYACPLVCRWMDGCVNMTLQKMCAHARACISSLSTCFGCVCLCLHRHACRTGLRLPAAVPMQACLHCNCVQKHVETFPLDSCITSGLHIMLSMHLFLGWPNLLVVFLCMQRELSKRASLTKQCRSALVVDILLVHLPHAFCCSSFVFLLNMYSFLLHIPHPPCTAAHPDGQICVGPRGGKLDRRGGHSASYPWLPRLGHPSVGSGRWGPSSAGMRSAGHRCRSPCCPGGRTWLGESCKSLQC
jgi:hypothetical protein